MPGSTTSKFYRTTSLLLRRAFKNLRFIGVRCVPCSFNALNLPKRANALKIGPRASNHGLKFHSQGCFSIAHLRNCSMNGVEGMQCPVNGMQRERCCFVVIGLDEKLVPSTLPLEGGKGTKSEFVVGVVVLGPLWEWCLCSLFVLCPIVAGFVTATSHILCPLSTPHVVRTRTCIIHTHMRAHTQTQSHSRAHTYA